jgi:hypothetical protein
LTDVITSNRSLPSVVQRVLNNTRLAAHYLYVSGVGSDENKFLFRSSSHLASLSVLIMAPAAPQGLTVSTLISAKGTQLKFWIVQTNEKAAKKVINVTGTVDQLRANLAAYYGFDLTVNPREDVMPAPTVDESIRDRQWADLEALGIEWKATVDAGGVFKLLESPNSESAP